MEYGKKGSLFKCAITQHLTIAPGAAAGGKRKTFFLEELGAWGEGEEHPLSVKREFEPI